MKRMNQLNGAAAETERGRETSALRLSRKRAVLRRDGAPRAEGSGETVEHYQGQVRRRDRRAQARKSG